MLKSCASCGRVHAKGIDCPKKPKPKKEKTEITKFRSSAKWKRVREATVRRDNYLCRVCLSKGIYKSEDLEVHHIVPLIIDFSLRTDTDNLITLCGTCHEKAECGSIPADTLRELVVSESPPPAAESVPGEP